MKKYILSFFLIGAIVNDGISQELWKLRRIDLTGAAGVTHFMGDVGGFTEGINYLGFRDLSVHNTGWYASLSVEYRIASRVSARADFSGGYLSADDIRGSNTDRGFTSQMVFFEPALITEFSFLKNKMENRYLHLRGKSTTHYRETSYYDIYILGGLGLISYTIKPNPILESAPQRTALSGLEPVIPVGIGIARSLPRHAKAGLELGRRFTFTDALDGYSARGSRRDVYYFLSLNYTWSIRTRRFPTF